MKTLLSLIALLGLAAVADACPGAVASRARAAFRPRVVVVQSYPQPMASAWQAPKASFPDLEARVARLEKNTADAGRALLFGTNAPATKKAYVAPVKPMSYAVAAVRSTSYKPVAPVRRAALFLGSVGGCPGGNCPK